MATTDLTFEVWSDRRGNEIVLVDARRAGHRAACSYDLRGSIQLTGVVFTAVTPRPSNN